jgi:hypothetical protein
MVGGGGRPGEHNTGGSCVRVPVTATAPETEKKPNNRPEDRERLTAYHGDGRGRSGGCGRGRVTSEESDAAAAPSLSHQRSRAHCRSGGAGTGRRQDSTAFYCLQAKALLDQSRS